MKGKLFFKDDVQLITKQRVPDGQGGFTQKEVPTGDIMKVFLDTPSSQDIFLANQLQQVTFDRYMYYPYGLPFERANKLQHMEEDGTVTKYEIVGKPENQGGQDRYMRANLKEVI